MKRILCVILLVLFAVGCADMQPEQIDDLKEKIIKANMDVNSFKFKSDNKMILQGPNESISMNLDIDGAMDRDAKKLMVKGEMNMDKMSLPVETYSDGEWIYTNNMGQWVKMKLESPDMFEMQDQAKYMVDFLKDSEIHAEEFTKDGKEVYKVDVKPTKEALIDLAQKNAPVPLEDTGLNIEDMFKNMQITYYINKDNYLAEKADVKYDIKINDVLMKNDMSFEMYDVNKPVDIVIPEEAKSAMDFSELQKQMAEQMAAQQMQLEDIEVVETEE